MQIIKTFAQNRAIKSEYLEPLNETLRAIEDHYETEKARLEGLLVVAETTLATGEPPLDGTSTEITTFLADRYRARNTVQVLRMDLDDLPMHKEMSLLEATYFAGARDAARSIAKDRKNHRDYGKSLLNRISKGNDAEVDSILDSLIEE